MVHRDPSAPAQLRRVSQPRALYLLSAVELLERAAGIAMLAVFPLYLRDHHGIEASAALFIAGAFWGVSYLMSLPGGWVADRVVGAERTMLGGLGALAVGYAGLALDCGGARWWLALGMLTVGHGLFKPALTTLIGRLYRPDDRRRTSGFMIFYFAVNVGAVLGPLAAQWTRNRWSWPALFAGAASLSLAAILLLVGGGQRLLTLGIERAEEGPVVPLKSSTEQERVRALLLLSAVSVVFWLAIQQTGSSLVLFAAEHTTREFIVAGFSFTLRPEHFTAFHGGMVLLLLPLLTWHAERRRVWGVEVSAVDRMVHGFVLQSAAFALLGFAGLQGGDAGRIGPLWLIVGYVLMTPGEIWLSAFGLSLVTRLAPPRMTARLTGLWLAAVAVGHWLGGALGLLWSRWPHHRYFAVVAVLTLSAAVVLLHRRERLEAIIGSRSVLSDS